MNQQRFLKCLWLLHTTKKFTLDNLLGPESESEQEGRDPNKKVQIRPDSDLDPQH
jgi:hypothetical protein